MSSVKISFSEIKIYNFFFHLKVPNPNITALGTVQAGERGLKLITCNLALPQLCVTALILHLELKIPSKDVI